MSTTVGSWLADNEDLDRLDREVLLMDALSVSRARILTSPEQHISTGQSCRINAQAAALRAGKPLAYVRGFKEFWGLTLVVDEQSLGGEVNAALIKQAFVMYHANQRQGSARSKTRSMGSLTGKKMYKQKGTGNARHGDKKAPIFRGGGHAKAKRRTREDYHKTMPIKMRRKAIGNLTPH